MITDYLSQYEKTGDQQFIDAIDIVIDAACQLMRSDGEALLFDYPAGISSYDAPFVSGLTQSRYMEVFRQLWLITGKDRFKKLARSLFLSHLVPVSRGGPYLDWNGKIVVEEYPFRVPTFVQNGWTTSLHLLKEYAVTFKDDDAHDLFSASMPALIELLPLYDARSLANSRYELTRPCFIRIVRKGDASLIFDGGSLEIDGVGFEIKRSLPEETGRWQLGPKRNQVTDTGRVLGRQFRINLLFCRISYPRGNTITLRIDSDADCEIVVEVTHGDFADSMFLGNHKSMWWEYVTRANLRPGRNVVSFEMPWDKVPLIGHPTNFGKHIGGKNYNVYHFIHIDNLRRLYKFYRDPVLLEWADRWEGYVAEWPEHRVYKGKDIVLYRFSGMDGSPGDSNIAAHPDPEART